MSSSLILQPSSLTYAIIPVKPLGQAKSRLARALKAPTRAALVRAMFSHTLDVIAQVERIDGAIVVSRDLTILELARSRSLIGLAESDSGLNPAITQAANWALRHAARSVVIVPVDVPLLTANDLNAILDLAIEPQCVVIAPDRHDAGTNVMLVRPPDAIHFAYGLSSFNAHRAQASACGLAVHVYRSPGIGLDIDVPDDLELYRAGNALLDGRINSE
jgi:2-phospho-L-lactate guanylyltransferase